MTQRFLQGVDNANWYRATKQRLIPPKQRRHTSHHSLGTDNRRSIIDALILRSPRHDFMATGQPPSKINHRSIIDGIRSVYDRCIEIVARSIYLLSRSFTALTSPFLDAQLIWTKIYHRPTSGNSETHRFRRKIFPFNMTPRRTSTLNNASR